SSNGTDGFAVEMKAGRLCAGERRRENSFTAGDGDVQRQMMTAELQHPRSGGGRCPEEGDVVEIASEHIVTGKAGRTASCAARASIPLTAARRRTVGSTRRWP